MLLLESVDGMNTEDLPVPQDPPPIPRGKFWACILIPPFLFPAFGFATGMGTLPLTLVSIIIGASYFVECMRVRYRGKSLPLLVAGYVLGEMAVCLVMVAVPFLIYYFG